MNKVPPSERLSKELKEIFERSSESRPGYRNGYEAKGLKSAEGEIALEVPQVRGRGETYRSEVVRELSRLSPQLKHLAVSHLSIVASRNKRRTLARKQRIERMRSDR